MKKLLGLASLCMILSGGASAQIFSGEDSHCSDYMIDAWVEVNCDSDRPRSYLNRVEFYYATTETNNVAMDRLGVVLSGQLLKACSAADNNYCIDDSISSEGMYSRFRFMGVDATVEIPVGDSGPIELTNGSVTLLEMSAGNDTKYFNGNGMLPMAGEDYTEMKVQFLGIEYQANGQSNLLNVQLPVNIMNIAQEVHYDLTKDGTLRVILGGNVDTSIGSSSINTNADYSRFNGRANIGAYSGIGLGKFLTATVGGRRAFNSNIIDSDYGISSNLDLRLSRRITINGSYNYSNIGLDEREGNILGSETISRFRIGARVKF